MTQELWLGAMDDDVSRIDDAIDAGVSVNAAAEEDGWTALHHAARSRAVCALQLLIDTKAALDVKTNEEETALHLLCDQGSEVLGGAGPGAPDYLKESLIQKLLDAGADANPNDGCGATPLYHATIIGQDETVRQLLMGKADMNHKNKVGMSPLHYAATHGDGNLIQVMIECKVGDLNATNSKSQTALHLAALGSHGQVFQSLMAAGAELSKDDEGRIPLDLVPNLNDPKWLESCSRASHYASTSPRSRTESVGSTGTPTSEQPPQERPGMWATLRGRFRSLSRESSPTSTDK